MKILPFLAVMVTLAISYACEKKKTEAVREVKKEQRIMDDANVLTTQEEDIIFSIMQDVERNVGSQIAILTIGTLNGEEIESFSLRMANGMGLGRKDYDDGILITVSLADRKTRIEVGPGLEKIIKDEIAARIIREDMGPRFGKDDFFNGIKGAVEKIKTLIEENKELVGQRP
jgi:uncharacterized protein